MEAGLISGEEEFKFELEDEVVVVVVVVEEEVEVGVPDAATLAASMAALLFKVSTR